MPKYGLEHLLPWMIVYAVLLYMKAGKASKFVFPKQVRCLGRGTTDLTSAWSNCPSFHPTSPNTEISPTGYFQILPLTFDNFLPFLKEIKEVLLLPPNNSQLTF